MVPFLKDLLQSKWVPVTFGLKVPVTFAPKVTGTLTVKVFFNSMTQCDILKYESLK